MKKFALAALMVAALMGSTNFARAEYIIDDFNAPAFPAGQFIFTTAIETVHNGASGITGAIGGARDMEISKTAGATGIGTSVSLGINSAPLADFLNYGQATGIDGNFAVVWDGDAAPAAQAVGGTGPVDITNFSEDITEGGINDRIEFRLLSNTTVLTTFTLEIYDDLGNVAARTEVIGTGTKTFNWTLSSFVGGPVDYTAVAGVRLVVDQAPSALGPVGTQLDRIAAVAVPEPTSIALLGMGVLGLVARSVRRRKQAA